jgi:hypothetical protein
MGIIKCTKEPLTIKKKNYKANERKNLKKIITMQADKGNSILVIKNHENILDFINNGHF